MSLVETGGANTIRRAALAALLTAAGYYLGALAGLSVLYPASPVAIVFPSNAILLAALMLTPVRTWWLNLLVIVPTHYLVTTQLQPGAPLVAMVGQVAGNCGQAVLAALAVRHFAGVQPRFDTLRSVTAFILFAAVVIPCLVSALVVEYFVLIGWVDGFWGPWRTRFFGNVFATLTVTPLLVLTIAGGVTAIRTAPPRRYAEFALLTFGLLLVGLPIFGMDADNPRRAAALLFTPLPFLLWAAVRFGARGLSVSLLMVAALAIASATTGQGPFLAQSPAENVLSLQVFLIAIALPLMLLAGLIEERANTLQDLQRSNDQTRALAGRLIATQEAEGARIARELHDDVSQRLAAISITITALKRQFAAQAGDELHAGLAGLQADTSDLAESIRQLSHNLHPGVLQQSGLVAALKSHCAEFAKQHAVNVVMTDDPGLGGVDLTTAVPIYRIVQEALRNTAKHAGARQVEITLSRLGGDLVLSIADDGKGFDLETVRRHGRGLGLRSIDERVRLAQGHLDIDTAPGLGTRLSMRFAAQ
jgi:signal transduction histidine kinase